MIVAGMRGRGGDGAAVVMGIVAAMGMAIVRVMGIVMSRLMPRCES